MKYLQYFLIIFSIVIFSRTSYSFDTKAKQAILMDYETGAILFAKNADDEMVPSSMTKLMTVYVIFDRLKNGIIMLNDEYTVSKKAWQKGGSKMFLKHTEKVTLDELLNGIIVQSGNDACIAAAEGISSSESLFAVAMNDTAKQIGLKNSNFVNSTGWPDEGHYMTAHDLAILSKRLITDFPEYYNYFARPEYKYNGIQQTNRNSLLFKKSLGVDGLKTGHTEAGGYGIAISAKKGTRRLIVVVNGLNSDAKRMDEAERLVNYGFRYFVNKKFFEKGDIIDSVKTWQGDLDKVTLALKEDVNLAVPKLSVDDIAIEVHHNSPITAPIKKGDEIAQLFVKVPEVGTFSYPLIANEDVQEAGLWDRIFSNFKYYIKLLLS